MNFSNQVLKKILWAVSGTLIFIACFPELPFSVIYVEITPPGDTSGTTLKASIETEGKGKITVEWMNARYDSVKVAKREDIVTDTAGVYSSIISSDLGWYWINIYNEGDSLLWQTDSVFCGPDSSLPIVHFSPNPESGAVPLTVTFSNVTKKDAYTRCRWDFGDGAASSDWEPVHTYDSPGVFVVRLSVCNLAGSSSDSAVIKVTEPLSVSSVEINPHGSSSKTLLTASIQVKGGGDLKVCWLNAVYDSVKTVFTDVITVDSNGAYESTFDSDLGWYWIDIFDEENSLLWHTDSVFCGPDSTVPEVVFAPSWLYGSHPLTVDFYNQTSKNEYTKWLWDFGDGFTTNSDWEPTHTYENAGQFMSRLYVYCLAGSSVDSTLIFVW